MGPLHNDIRSFLERPGNQGLDAHRDRVDLLAEPDDEALAGRGHRNPQGRVRIERRDVQGRDQLLGDRRPQHFTDGVRRDHPGDAEPGGELRGNRRLADTGGAAQENDERLVELLDRLPFQVAAGMALVDLGQQRRRQVAQLLAGDLAHSLLVQHLLHLLGDPIGLSRGDAGHHHRRRHQPFRVWQAVALVGDVDMRRCRRPSQPHPIPPAPIGPPVGASSTEPLPRRLRRLHQQLVQRPVPVNSLWTVVQVDHLDPSFHSPARYDVDSGGLELHDQSVDPVGGLQIPSQLLPASQRVTDRHDLAPISAFQMLPEGWPCSLIRRGSEPDLLS